MNAARSGAGMVARHGGAFLCRGAASTLCTESTATPQHITHYLAHHPRATWEALSASFPAAAAPGRSVDAVLLALARHPNSSSEPIARNAHTFFHWSASSSSSSHSLRSYFLLVHLLCRTPLIRHAAVIIESSITKHSQEPTSSFLDAFFAAYEDSGTAATTRGLHVLVHAYSRLRLPGEALEACCYLARRGVLPSLSAFNAVLHAAQRSGRFQVAWEVFELMTLKRVYANQGTVELVIGVLSREGALGRMAALVERIHGKKCAPGIMAHVALALWTFEEGRTDQGVLLLRRMLQRNMVFDDIAYSLIVHAYCHIGDLKLAREQRDDMVRRGCRLNAFVYTCLIRVHCHEGDVNEAVQLLQEMLSVGLKPYDATYSHLITGCFRQERTEEGSEYFDKMLHKGLIPDVGTCNEILEVLCDAGEVGKANDLVTAMIDKGIIPNQDTYCRLFDGYGKVCDAQGITKIYYEMEHRGLNHGVEVFTSLIRGLCQCGNPKEAEKSVSVMERKLLAPTSDIHDLLIRSYCEKGNTKSALQLYDKMMTRSDKLVPSADTFMMLVRRVIRVNTTCSPNRENTPYEESDEHASYVSPLHEALRGTTAMPTLESFQQRYHSSTPPLVLLHAPQEPATTPPVAVHPPPASSGSALASLPPPYGATSLTEANLLTAPAINHAWPVPGGHPQGQRVCTHLGPCYKEPYGAAPDVNPTNVFPSRLSTNTHTGMASSSAVTGATRREYTCEFCNVTFHSSQAFGGHMSSHSKMRKKMMLGLNPPN